MNLVQFEPWSIADIIRRDFDPFANRSYRSAQRLPATWSPAVDIVEEAGRFVVRADVPGVDAADIDPARFVVMGRGQYAPTVPNADERARALNRRVEILITRTTSTSAPGAVL